MTGTQQPVVFSHDWSVPRTGRLLLDFVEITRGASWMPPAPPRRVAALMRRLQLIAALLPAHEVPGASLQALREFLARNYVCCEQVCQLLQAAPGSQARTEVFVKAFARVVDWHNLVCNAYTCICMYIYIYVCQGVCACR